MDLRFFTPRAPILAGPVGMLANATVPVLLVEEDDFTARHIVGTLRADGNFRIEHVTTVSNAEHVLQHGRYSIILLSLSAPDFPGLSAFALIQGAANRAPIILLANPTDEPLALKAVRQGAADYLVRSQIYKTVLIRTLKHAIEVNASESRYRALFEQSRDAIFMTDRDSAIVESNRALLDLLGYEAADIVGRPIESLFADAPDRLLLLQEQEAKRAVTDMEVRMRRKDGRIVWCLISIVARHAPDGNVPGYQGIIHDITDRKRAEERLIYNAYHDVLTGLPNRALFVDRLDRALVRWRRHRDRRFAVMFIDLNRFKFVNDSLGHSAGDELLKKVGEIIQDCLREEDTVARLGGDEFAILLDHIDSTTDATTVAERIHSCLESPVTLGNQNVFTSCSIGVAFSENENEKAEDLLRNADLAMYRAKSNGAGSYSVYSPGMHASALSVMELDMELHEALRNEEFELHYQPIYSIASNRVSGFEALLRWRNPKRGVLLPPEFLPLAEETGLILPIGKWVMRQACQQLALWQAVSPGKRIPFVSLNISGKQLTQAGFVAETAAIVRDTHVDPGNLMFELTETSLLQNPESCAVTIGKLRSVGVRFCIDDFGTGYSSLSYLHRLPPVR